MRTAWLVTGARGQLGTDLQEALAGRPGDPVTAVGRAELDLTDEAAVRETVRAWLEVADADRHVLVNAAAYTAVDAAEDDEATALLVNGAAPGWLAEEMAGRGRLVHVSTDYVFDGEADSPYVESSLPAPTGAYGRSKLAGEEQVRAAGNGHAIVRTAWLFRDGGPNFVDTMLRLGRERDEVRVVFDQVGSPTWTGHLAPAVADVLEARGAGIFHAAGAGRCSWFELAIEAMRVAGLDCRVVAIPGDEYPTPTKRPAFSVLETERADGVHLPPWQDGVKGHLST